MPHFARCYSGCSGEGNCRRPGAADCGRR